MERFCAWQERCENDVRKKLTSFHLSEAQEVEIINQLKENNFLNEDRFVELYVRGKVRVGWGKQKIVAALRAKHIPAELANRYCAAITDEDYGERLQNAIEKWRRTHPDETPNSPKLVRYLLSKGFGIEEVMTMIR